MKKILNVFCVMIVAMIAIVGVGTFAAASSAEDESDRVFFGALEKIVAEEGIDARVIEIDRDAVYDISLVPLGYIYTMNYDGKEGFALVINNNGIFDLTEFYMDAANPYANYSGKKVYVNMMQYLVYCDGEFIEPNSGNVLDEEVLAYLREKAFCGTDDIITTGTETVYYTNKSVDEYKMAFRHPTYFPVGENITNACAPASGANIIGFWTRYYPELIPGFTPGSVQLGVYIYKEIANESAAVVSELFYSMKTNSTAAGTTIPNFKTGMNNYVKAHGRSIDMASCMSGGKFDFTAAKQKMKDGTPLVLFVDCFRVDALTQQTDSMFINYYIANAAHTLAGFGYNEITYTLTNGTKRTDTYIQVATGLAGQPKGYYNINYNTTIDDCYAVNIY